MGWRTVQAIEPPGVDRSTEKRLIKDNQKRREAHYEERETGERECLQNPVNREAGETGNLYRGLATRKRLYLGSGTAGDPWNRLGAYRTTLPQTGS